MLDMAGRADAARELVWSDEQMEGGEVVAPADIILSAFASPEQDAGVVAGRGLAGLHVEAIGVQRHLARDGDAALIGAEIVRTGSEAERRRELPELAPRAAVEQTLAGGGVGDGFPKVESGGGGGAGHG